MKDFIKDIGNALIILIVGLCPMLFGVIYSALSGGGKYESLIMSISMLAGAFLCLFVLKRQYNIDIKNYIEKPKVKTSVLIVLTALAYEMTVLLTAYKPILSTAANNNEISAEVIEWVAAVIFSPAAEELIFRFSMLSLLLVKCTSISKKAAAVLITSVMWSLVHFSGYLPRIIDIIAVGILLGYIFIKYKNIFYCIFFHSAANFTVSIPDAFFLENNYILYISLPLCLLCILILFFPKNNRIYRHRKFKENIE